jgi:predicted membrane channel-forming protein YqfA (hemolysin III family)
MKKIKPIDVLILTGGVCGVALAIERAAHQKWIGVFMFGVMGVSALFIFSTRFTSQKNQ